MSFDIRRLEDGDDEDRPLRVLALGPHVDDVEIGCGATLLRLKRYHRAQVDVRVFSDHYAVPQHQDRSLEGRAAAELMGYDSLGFFQMRDTEFPAMARDLQERVAGLRDQLEPDLVLSPNARDTHQDHVALAQAIAREFRYGESIWCYEINQFGTDYHFRPNLYLDVGLPSLSTLDGFVECAAKREPLGHENFMSGDATDGPIGAVLCEDTLAHEKIYILRKTMVTQAAKPLLKPEILSAIMVLRGMQASRRTRFAEAFDARTIVHS